MSKTDGRDHNVDWRTGFLIGLVSGTFSTVVETLEGLAFEERFLPIMILHHQGAIRMADNASEQAGDPRIRILADSIRHSQRGQIERLAALFRREAPVAEVHPSRDGHWLRTRRWQE